MDTIKFRQKGDFKKLYGLLERYKHNFIGKTLLEEYAQRGLEALIEATPVRTGKTAASWNYEITLQSGLAKITFFNKNIQNGNNIALLIQYGHGNKNGVWIEGRDYINPVIQPLFDQIVEEAIAEIKKS